MASTLLLEIGCEELPTSFLDGALGQLRALVPDELAKARVAHGDVRVLGTARMGNRVNGVVEIVETGSRHPFTNAAGLWAIVAGGKVPLQPIKKQKKKTLGVE